MKKSKFLKKSLAMLLAVMLVVAMIPLSASAAAPVMRQVDVEAGGQNVQLVQGEDANTYVGEISNLSRDIELTVLAGQGNLVYFTNMATTATVDELAAGPANGLWTISIPANETRHYENDNGDYEIHFSVADEDRPATRLEYTVLLTPVNVSTDLGIERFTINNVNHQNVQLGETVIGAEDIYFTVPYDAWAASQVPDFQGYVIRELELTSATATVSFSRGAASTDGGTDYYYTTEATTNKVVTDGDPVIMIQDEDELTITNNDNTRTYTIHITPATGFTSFTTEEGLDAVMFPEDGKIAVLLPYGYSFDEGSVTVTPVFSLDFPSAEASWTSGTPITVNEADIITGHNSVANPSVSDFATFETYLAQDDETDTNAVSWTYRKNHEAFNESWASFVRSNPENDPDIDPSTVTISYTEKASRTYEVYFFEPFENESAEITELTIGSETAVIDQEAKTIDITLPMGTDVSDLNGFYTDVDLTASNGADVDIPMRNVTFTENTNARERYAEFDTDTDQVIDATNSVEIRVVSEDDLTENFYTLNVTVSDEFVKPAITDMTLKDGDDSYEGEIINDEEDNTSIIRFELPYEVYNNAQLNGWNLFYTKTVGSSITFGMPAVSMPKSGAELVGTTAAEPYLPDINGVPVGDAARATVALDLNVNGGDELSAMATSYYIEIVREEPRTDSTLTGFTLTSDPDLFAANPDYDENAELGSRFVYSGVIEKDEEDPDEDVVNVTIPWSVFAEWADGDPFEAVAQTAADANARVFYVSSDGTNQFLLEMDPDGTPTEKEVAGQPSVNLWELYQNAQIVVMSEQLWVNLLEEADNDTDFSFRFGRAPHDDLYRLDMDDWNGIVNGVANDTDMGNYTVYTLNLIRDEAATGNELSDVKLVDGTGWTAALDIYADGSTGRIEGEIPYALTSEITVNTDNNGDITGVTVGDSVNPVYLEYNTSPYAFVMGEDVTPNNRPNEQDYSANRPTWDTDPDSDYDVPTAGTDRDGVFIDMADYLELYDDNYDLALENYFEDGNPYLLIARNGDVFIFNGGLLVGGTVNGAVWNNQLEVNRLAVSAEDGDGYQAYDFDLEVLPVRNGAQVNSFWFEEYPTRKGVIDEATKTITVTLPYGTDLTAPEYTYLTPNFEVSDGAIVTIDDPVLQGKPLFPGYTDVNFSTTRKMTVIAENEADSTSYTIRVVVEEQFSDVNPGDWFYDNVMDAAANGYVNGYTDGTFGPTKSITRAEFAALVANVMGYETNNDVDSAFKDVEQGHWANGAIAFCAERGYINGYTDGTFQPSKTITRQEAASILKNTFNLTGNTGDLFPDDSAIASWAKDNVYAVKHSGLMKGDAGTGMFRPTSSITRAEAASIMVNADRAGLIG